jgi:hypothetical protein
MNTRPLALGYIRARVMTTEEVDTAKAHLAVFASAEGYVLGTVYVEHATSAPAGFHALLDEASRDHDVRALVPSPRGPTSFDTGIKAVTPASPDEVIGGAIEAAVIVDIPPTTRFGGAHAAS